ncbi:MAG: RecX family transcriptional regulator [Caulobacteraceae bacterium]|nr:RecX family transcriptional regulator [Caulobacteraceae bacterium]
MPAITALEPQGRKGRLNVFVDGQFVIGVGEAVAADLGLRIGREMTPEKLREVAGAEEVHKATEAALGLLEVRARARREVETRLRQKGYEDDVIARVVEKLTRLGLLDDAQFAAQWVEAKTRAGGSRPVGRRRLSQELFQKGVGKDEAAQAVEAVSDEDEMALARAAARKKVRAVPADRDALQAERQRLIGFLQRRGFGWDVVKRVAREALPAPGDAEDDADDLGDEP